MLIVETHNAQRRQDRTDMLTQAYLTASWQRAKRMPKFDKVLKDFNPEPKITKIQTAEEMLDFAKRFMGEEGR